LTAGVSASFYQVHQEANERNVVDYLSFAPENPSSIRTDRKRPAEFALGAHGADRRDVGHHQFGLDRSQEIWGKGTRLARRLTKFLRFGAGNLAAVRRLGLPDHAAQRRYWFSRLGLHLERADNTARILDVKYHVLLPEEEHVGGPLDYYQWTSILRSVSALTAYHWVYRETLKTLADRRSSDPQRLAAAVAGELLRQSGAQPRPDRRRLWPPGSFPAPCPRGAQPA